MSEQVPTKDLVSRLRWTWADHGIGHNSEYTADLMAAADRIEHLETALRGIQSCSTCEACRGAATLALGGAEPVKQGDIVQQMRLAGYHDWASAVERLQRPAHEREPPHCPNCACGLPFRGDVVGVIQAELDAEARDGAPPLADRIAIALGGADLLWREDERPEPTRMGQSNASGCPCKGHPTNCSRHPYDCGCSVPCEQLEGACPNCNQWVVLKCPAQPPPVVHSVWCNAPFVPGAACTCSNVEGSKTPAVCTDCLATPSADGKVQHREGCSATYLNQEIIR